MGKKIALFCFSFSLMFGYCCPQSCDIEVAKAFDKIKSEIQNGYDANIEKIQLLEVKYNNLITQENNSTKTLIKYLNRLKFEYIESAKSGFEIKKNTALKALQ